ncbi:hypothetical protein [Castellaniella denitrificans]|uniref:hypothetical protein n=1 Tax=Castellaniella denitrificans TaxID=56119 RepID=UPI0036201FBD
MSIEDLIDTGRHPRAVNSPVVSRMIGSADRLARVAKRAVITLDELIAEHGDMPISDDLADRLTEIINTMEAAASEVSATTRRAARHA